MGETAKSTAWNLLLLLTFLYLTNPSRLDLDAHISDSFKHSLVKGVKKYIDVNLSEYFGHDQTYSDMYFVSYLRSPMRGHYVGIGGFWIDPSFWKSPAGKLSLLTLASSMVGIVLSARLSMLRRIILSFLYFCFFSDTVSTKFGKDISFTLLSVSFSVALVCIAVFGTVYSRERTASVRSLDSTGSIVTTTYRGRRFSYQFIAAHAGIFDCLGTACLVYLSKHVKQPKSYLIDPSAALNSKYFTWNSMEIEYPQAAIGIIIFQLATLNYAGLAGAVVGFAFDEYVEFVPRWAKA